MFADPSQIFSGPDDMTMDELRKRTKGILKEKRAKSMKAAINKALKEANINKPKKPKKRPANMNKGGMVNDMRKSGLFR